MRSKTGKIKLALDRVQRLKYKTLRRMDKMKTAVAELNKIEEKLRGELNERI